MGSDVDGSVNGEKPVAVGVNAYRIPGTSPGDLVRAGLKLRASCRWLAQSVDCKRHKRTRGGGSEIGHDPAAASVDRCLGRKWRRLSLPTTRQDQRAPLAGERAAGTKR